MDTTRHNCQDCNASVGFCIRRAARGIFRGVFEYFKARAKIIAATLLALTAVTLIISAIFNFPIRFRPKWNLTPGSHRVWYPSSAGPDNIVLGPADDMSRSLSVTWRTSSQTQDGVVEYRPAEWEKENGAKENNESGTSVKVAKRSVLHCPELKNDNETHSFSVVLDGLQPGTSYNYRVGSPSSGRWSEWSKFSTTEEAEESGGLSFVFLGDTQLSARTVGKMLGHIEAKYPYTAFYAIGGDIVEMGEFRNHWDEILHYGKDAFSQKPVIPTRGNHDVGYARNAMNIYRHYFNLHEQPEELPEEISCYSFDSGPVHFTVLDSNSHLAEQRIWLDEDLRKASENGSIFKVVMFHFPVYHVNHRRFGTDILREWMPVLDRHGVDLVLNGHEHSYMRSIRVRSGIPDPEGTVYVVANSSVKHRRNRRISFAEKQITKVQTYQIIDIEPENDGAWRLRYRAMAADNHRVVDEFSLVKTP